MSNCQESDFFGDQAKTISINMDTSSGPKVEKIEVDSNVEDENCEDEKKEEDDEHSEGKSESEHIFYTNSEYADMKGNPKMSYEYSSARPAAGFPTEHGPYNTEPTPKGRRHYKTADDTFDHGMNNSGNYLSGRSSRESTPGRQEEGHLYSNSEYAKMKGDPNMRYEYSIGRPAAGFPSPHNYNYSREASPVPSRYSERVDPETVEREMDKSGTCSPRPGPRQSIPDPDSRNMSQAQSQSDGSETEVHSYTNSEYADMKGDPTMRYEYSSARPAAGQRPSSQNTYYNTTQNEIKDEKEEELKDEDDDDDNDKIVESEGHSYTNSEYAKMKGDSKMKYEYSSARPAAGQRPSNTGQNMEHNSYARRQY